MSKGKFIIEEVIILMEGIEKLENFKTDEITVEEIIDIKNFIDKRLEHRKK